MSIRAVIFDIYGTLLEFSAPPADASERWLSLWRESFKSEPRMQLSGFKAATDAVIAREHTAAREAGIQFPEIFWPVIVGAVLPEFAPLQNSARDEFLVAHARLTHTLRLMPGAADELRRLRERGTIMGLVSNCQPYSLIELKSELVKAQLNLGLFHPSLRFLSFEHGFSKPDPHVFRFIAAQLRTRGIATAEALVVGDRMDNDIQPARAQGFQTWRIGPPDTRGGDWGALSLLLEED